MPRLTELKKHIVLSRIYQADLAAALGVGESRMSRIVNGRTAPTDREIALLAKELRLSGQRIREFVRQS